MINEGEEINSDCGPGVDNLKVKCKPIINNLLQTPTEGNVHMATLNKSMYFNYFKHITFVRKDEMDKTQFTQTYEVFSNLQF